MSDPTNNPNVSSEYTIKSEDHFRPESTRETLKEKSRHVAGEAKRRAEETLSSARAATSETYRRAKNDAAQLYGRGRETVKESFSEHPLAYAIGAFAAGLVIGMLLPTSKSEGSLLGSVTGKAKAKGQELSARSEEALAHQA